QPKFKTSTKHPKIAFRHFKEEIFYPAGEMKMTKLIVLFVAMLVMVKCSPTTTEEVEEKRGEFSTEDTAVEDALENVQDEDLSDLDDEEDEDEDEDAEEMEDPTHYRRKCRYVRKCRSSKKCSRVRIPAKHAGKGQYKKPRYQLRCKPVRRCRRVRICRKVRIQRKYRYRY
uniref:Uncharacterized protein n=1 Tax=Clytia hemisphaerica TaxID=252671 RepID=A0A7M5XCS3_9CNID